MRRLAWSQLRFRTIRLVALLAGMLLATTAFTVLTAASRTAQLRTIGTVSAHFVPAYDILVRPKGARTALETQTGTVQPNFLSGVYGGISMVQYHQIQQIPGVRVCAARRVHPRSDSGHRLRPARPPALPDQYNLGKRRWHQPHQPAAFVHLRHAERAQVHEFDRLDGRGASWSPEQGRLPDEPADNARN